ncbi:juvenile hormone acid O-methyltransferase-like, partial [Photinus pyralis]|uniref:juvenile hormone acid O-methyltransferase-like n=1 Tax=Photinus pyralis TaxID=7054 RepID=UPI0012671722
MYRAELFQKSSVIAQRDAQEVMDRVREMVKWKENCNVLDIGCGTGNVTHDFLLPILPKSTKVVIGVDKFAGTVEYARQHYGRRIVFEQMDIVYDTITNGEYYDHIFSFYCLPFIKEQDIALKNIYKLLKPGGDFIFTCTVQCNLFEVGNAMSRIEKWKPYLVDYE